MPERKGRRLGALAAGGVLLAAAASAVVATGAETVSAARRSELLHLLANDCGACHGLSLKGGLGPPLRPADLAGKSEEALVVTVLEGRSGTPMPPWRDLLSETEVRWLVQHLMRGETP